MQYYLNGYSFNAVKPPICFALILGLIAFTYKFPLSFIFNQLEIRLCIYLLSAFLIILLGNIRLGLSSKDLSFDLTKYKLSLLILLIFALLVEFNYISYFYLEYGYLLVAVSPESLGKYIANIVKPYKLIPNYMMTGPENAGDKVSVDPKPVFTGNSFVNAGSFIPESYNPNLEAANDLIDMFRSLGNNIEYQEKAKDNLKKFFMEIAKFTKESEDLDSPLKAKIVKELGIYVRN